MEHELELLVGIATLVGVLVTMFALLFQIKSHNTELIETRKSRSAEIAHYYNRRLEKDSYIEINEIISSADTNNRIINIGIAHETDSFNYFINEFDLDSYLSELETLSLFVNDGVINLKYAYELFSDDVIDMFNNKDIFQYMENSKAELGEYDLWDNLYKTHQLLLGYKNKKFSMVNNSI